MNKYRNVVTELDGVKFSSRKEAARYSELKLLQRAGEIHGLELQPKFELWVNSVRVGNYIGDFRYVTSHGAEVIEDAKGMKTPVYRLKKKLMLAIHNIQIQEI